jgi:hypothetical protein
MADLTKTSAIRNGASADATSNAGAASQTIVYDRSDENIVIRVANADAATATIVLQTDGYGGGDASNTTFTVAQNEVKYIGALESMYFKAPATGKVTVLIQDDDGTAFSGTVTNVTIEVVDLPKSLVN